MGEDRKGKDGGRAEVAICIYNSGNKKANPY